MHETCGRKCIRNIRPDFTIVVHDPAPEVRRVDHMPGVEVTGTVDDVRPYYQMAAEAHSLPHVKTHSKSDSLPHLKTHSKTEVKIDGRLVS
jgi:hypothetical protein